MTNLAMDGAELLNYLKVIFIRFDKKFINASIVYNDQGLRFFRPQDQFGRHSVLISKLFFHSINFTNVSSKISSIVLRFIDRSLLFPIMLCIKLI